MEREKRPSRTFQKVPGMDHDTLNESLLEKLKIYSQKPHEQIEGIRSVSAKLHSRVTAQDRNIKTKTLERIWQKNQGGLTLILYMLETVRDPLASCSLAGILHECVSAKAGKTRSPAVSQLVHLNATQSLVKHLNHLQVKESVSTNDSLVQEIIWILSQLAQRDAKFSLKTRLLGAVKTFHYFLKSYTNHPKLLFPILQIIKALSRNTTTAGALAKDGIVASLERVLANIGFSPSCKLRVAMNILTYLSKNKLCCGRMIQTSVLPMVLRVFERWEKYDGKIRIKLCNSCLVTLQRVCYLKSGRKAIRTTGGLLILHKFCLTCPDEKCFDSLLTRACGVITFCLDRQTLPLNDIVGPGKFVLPKISEINLSEKSSSYQDGQGDFDEGDSDDELVEDPEEDGVVQLQGIDPDDAKMIPPMSVERDLEDLKQYSQYCSEFMMERKTSQAAYWNQVSNSYKLTSKDKSGSVEDKEDVRFVSSDSSLTITRYNRGRKLTELSNNISKSKKTQPVNTIKSMSKENMLLLKSVRNLHGELGFNQSYCYLSTQINSVIPFVKVAYPDMVGGDGIGVLEPLNTKDRKICRQKLIQSMERCMHPPPNPIYNVVYDLDAHIAAFQKFSNNKENRELFNDDEVRLGESVSGSLEFESRFESGNLRKAIQVGPREYELILSSDVGSDKHHNWFYFEVSNMDNSGGPYQFNIVNFEKMNSQFNYGMKPIMYSVREATEGRPGWFRTGSEICYYRNSYQKTTGQQKCYYTTSFSIDFPHSSDVCYIAYHFPYTYTQLLRQLWRWSLSNDFSKIYFKTESLCYTLNNNQVPMLTITSAVTENSPISERETIFLTARVHPGETNASWIMLGTVDHLLSNSPQAVSLRNKYVFKIVPMLNVEGVINGCNRCGLSNEDLNRRWKSPHPVLHPEIYHTKGLLEYCCKVLQKPPYLFCDFHGHSRKKNVFLYGCANNESWAEYDRQQNVSPVEYLLIAHLMKHFCPAFAFNSCKFHVERSRESTARVAVWRDFGIKRSYTMESSYCGCDQGMYTGYHLDTKHLKEIGSQFCEVVACLQDETTWRLELMLESQEAASRFGAITGVKPVQTTESHSDMLENSDSDSSDENFSFDD